MITLTVNTDKQYPIIISNGWKDFPKMQKKGKKICIITDENIAPYYLKEVKDLFKGAENVFSYQIPAGERSKSAEVYLNVLAFLAQKTFNREDFLVALGGGVVGDLTGFVASTYMRGITYYQIPTTLLAMIDSSIGGKTGIDLPEGKNLVGTFYQPSAVYVNLNVLSTLPQEEYQNGLGELAKYALLSTTISREDLTLPVTEELIAKCLKIKANVVENDEKETGLRKLLNLGHTVGHAIEMLSCYSIPHGICVAKGLLFTIEASAKYYAFSPEKKSEMLSVLQATNIDLSPLFSTKEILRAVVHDKKSKGEGVDFVCISEIGKCQTQFLTFQQLEELL